MKILIFQLLLILALDAAGQKKYYQDSSSILNDPTYNRDILVLHQSDYTLYVRTIYKDALGGERRLHLNPSLSDTVGKTLIEVNYLLISVARNNCIYISCMVDKYEGYYKKNWLGPEYINIYDIQHIDFGKFSQKDKVEFRPKKKSSIFDTWKVEKKYQEIEIVTISAFDSKKNKTKIFDLRSELGKRMIFQKVPIFSIVFWSTGTPLMGTKVTNDTAHLADNTIYILEKDRKFRVYFKMDRIVGTNKFSVPLDCIFFLDERVTYDPLELFIKN